MSLQMQPKDMMHISEIILLRGKQSVPIFMMIRIRISMDHGDGEFNSTPEVNVIGIWIGMERFNFFKAVTKL
jgi:hypothetical protein